MMQALRTVAAVNDCALICALRLAGWRTMVGIRHLSEQGGRDLAQHRVVADKVMESLRTQQRALSGQALTTPTPQGAPKVFPEKIEQLVAEISQLTLVEVADLNQLLKQKLNIPDAPVMAFGSGVAAPAPVQEEEEEEVAAPTKVQTSFTLKMHKYDQAKKVALIKEVKARLDGYNLVQAKKFVESVPAVVKADIPKDEAEKLLEAFNAAGAECEII